MQLGSSAGSSPVGAAPMMMRHQQQPLQQHAQGGAIIPPLGTGQPMMQPGMATSHLHGGCLGTGVDGGCGCGCAGGCGGCGGGCGGGCCAGCGGGGCGGSCGVGCGTGCGACVSSVGCGGCTSCSGYGAAMDMTGMCGVPSTAPTPAAAEPIPCYGIYACDLMPQLDQRELRQVFILFGELASFQQVSVTETGQAVIVEYTTTEAAVNAQAMINHALVRGRNCRCLLMSSLQTVQETMVSGSRLMVENVDPAIETHRLADVCDLFGKVLDCKVETDDAGVSKGYGFVHFAEAANAKKAMDSMNNIQVGALHLSLRPFEWKDVALFGGCCYLAGMQQATMSWPVDHSGGMMQHGVGLGMDHGCGGMMSAYHNGGMQQCW
eukprot:TRINITY_DN62153_c0_g1_i1.p1 TRINITY_DN62153_c0_g1~~TRINITY_DN62153_c0_g1_i1.p1  ORF type:complete len:378 (+),score=76.06 TRINITY_DN62153_c0_g1_i1:110-1243(+)